MGDRRYKIILGCLGICIICGILSGCSLSFCGLCTGRQEELVFSCDEDAASKVWDAEGTATEAADIQTEQPEPKDNRINLNTADKEELMTLQGIGESRAEAILAYREEKGAFKAIEDIMQISGIKEGIFSKIKDQITVLEE